MKVWLQSYTPAMPRRHLVTASLCFRGLFFWDALYTRNRDSERSMINATILERRFERRLQTRFWLWVLKRDSTLGKGDKRTQGDIWNAFEPQTRFCRDDKRKVVLKRLYNVSQKKEP